MDSIYPSYTARDSNILGRKLRKSKQSVDKGAPPVADAYWAPGYPAFIACQFYLAKGRHSYKEHHDKTMYWMEWLTLEQELGLVNYV